MLSVLPVASVLLGSAAVSDGFVSPVPAGWLELPPVLPSEARLDGVMGVAVGGGGENGTGGGEARGGGGEANGGVGVGMAA